MSLKQIGAKLGLSKSSVSLWVRDPALPRLTDEQCRQLRTEASRRYWERERALRQARREVVREAAAHEIGGLSDREIMIAGAIAYWCEGAKGKPHRKAEQVSFINSDPGLIGFYLRFLEAAGVPRLTLTFRVYIHEVADVAAAQRFWLGVTRAEPEQFRRPTLKRHNPKTVRMNVSDDYRGCLRVDVQRGAELYQRIEGWIEAMFNGPGASIGSGSEPP